MRVWHEARSLSVRCGRVTRLFPNDERFELSRQMRRASVSFASNIAEGCGRRTERELVRFLRISYGSACELETQAHIAQESGLGRPGELQELIEHTETVRRTLWRFIDSVENAPSREP